MKHSLIHFTQYILTATGSTAEINEPKSRAFKIVKSKLHIPATPANDKPKKICNEVL